MEPKSRAHAELIRLTEKRGEKLRLSRLIGVQPNQLTQWVELGITPSGPNRTKIEAALGIRSIDWDAPVAPKRQRRAS